MKRLHGHAARDPALLELFVAECRLTCELAPSPHVVRGHAFDIDAPRPYLVMDVIDGPDLRARIAADPVARGDALAILRGAAAGLAHLHAQGWVHGDVNPGNLLCGTRGAVLCDLGISRALGAAGPVRGTAAYMAPEQVRGEPWTGAVDVFALGVIAWELATGTRLFHRGAVYLSMAAVIEYAAPPLDDATLAPLVAAMLAKDPSARPSAAELAASFAAL